MSSMYSQERDAPPTSGPGRPEGLHIDDLLRLTAEAQASDLHLKAGRPPVLRTHGRLVAHNSYGALTEADMRRFLEQIANREQLETFDETLELDISYALPSVARYRVNVAMQRKSVTMVMRRLDETIPPIDSLGLPAICQELVMRPRACCWSPATPARASPPPWHR